MRQEYTERLDERDRSPDSGVPEERLEYLRTGIMDLESKQMEGTIIRSRIRYREEGEKCSKYFIDLEKRNAVNKTIDSLRSAECELLIEPEAISKEQVNFYTELYTDEGVDATAQDILLNNLDKELPDSYINKCEGVLSLEEATKAIRALKNNKSPGHDGLSAEFYKPFWDILGPDFIAVSNAAFDKGILMVSQRRVEVFSVNIRKEDKIRGITLRDRTVTNIYQYVDDTMIQISDIDSVRILGFHLGNNDTSQLNWKPRVGKLKTILRSWNRRTLSYKANIINMPTIYKDCLRAWHSVGVINTKPQRTIAHVLDTPKFLNTGLTLGNKRSLFNADFITNDLRTVGT
ncbi:hypothetical protein LSH36_1781g00013 [Paralvinella palmiformis]|uniref:Reverse transcriptase domain-containing protein n=1 Tax=Paralvinella palmiformis TaxID=53620 RepID=A0AAD9IRR1_9ANNE|nr:hypothetical protein LSH36_1781g00013 [Paralvinella palmiformis]